MQYRWGILRVLCFHICQHAGIRLSKGCGVLGYSCRDMMRNKQPFLTAPAFFSNLLFHVSFVTSSDYPMESGKRSLVSFCIYCYRYFSFLMLFDHQLEVQKVREIFVVVSQQSENRV